MEAVKEGVLSIGQAARQFNVPETKLRGRIAKHGIVPKLISGLIIFDFKYFILIFCL